MSVTELIGFIFVALTSLLGAKGTSILIRQLLDDNIALERSKMVARPCQYMILAMDFYLWF